MLHSPPSAKHSLSYTEGQDHDQEQQRPPKPGFSTPTAAVANPNSLTSTSSSSPPSGSTASHLQLFVKAKQKINEIYHEVGEYVNSAQRFLISARVQDDKCQTISEYARKVEGIRSVLKRNHMKVVFFGRTSNGKSTAINALLGDRILPIGIGHTTSCFLQVRTYILTLSYTVTPL